MFNFTPSHQAFGNGYTFELNGGNVEVKQMLKGLRIKKLSVPKTSFGVFVRTILELDAFFQEDNFHQGDCGAIVVDFEQAVHFDALEGHIEISNVQFENDSNNSHCLGLITVSKGDLKNFIDSLVAFSRQGR